MIAEGVRKEKAVRKRAKRVASQISATEICQFRRSSGSAIGFPDHLFIPSDHRIDCLSVTTFTGWRCQNSLCLRPLESTGRIAPVPL
jgi:hypothetical protein